MPIFWTLLPAAALGALLLKTRGLRSRPTGACWKYRCSFQGPTSFDARGFVQALMLDDSAIEPAGFIKRTEGAICIVELDYVASDAAHARMLAELRSRSELSAMKFSRTRHQAGAQVIQFTGRKAREGRHASASEAESHFRKRMRRG